ncbi:hypothetical protein BH11MYX1_BH11MYX1_13120 [soil metagenome]
MKRLQTVLVLLPLFVTSISRADAVSDRARKTADGVIDLSLRLVGVMDGADCKVVLENVTKFAKTTATERTALASELDAAKKDRAYGDALKLELQKNQATLKGMKRPLCAKDPAVRSAARNAMPAGA